MAFLPIRGRLQRTLGKQRLPWPRDPDDEYRLLELDAVRAVAEAARADVDNQVARARALDAKLSNIAAFSGVSISVGGALGAAVILSPRLALGFRIAAAALLVLGMSALLVAVWVSFRGLDPKGFRVLSVDRGRRRVERDWLAQDARQILWTMAHTDYAKRWPLARRQADLKADSVRNASKYARLGLIGIIVTLALASVGSVT